MYNLVFLICSLMILYGAIRFAVAKKKSKNNPNIHLLWIPGGSFLYLICITTMAWGIHWKA
ncbi:hypothetical protein [Effusibacillus lacus]|uniref:hypothetical protein n=1 Tax=Effusibacillus lacus TaxID=1348429 RepID=UPI000BB78387|nr:hypothetical protein [Effusibacillus lacus]TCS68163.1 hypothetical protein EDD64_14515 [Effusibacillus lacus]